MMRRLIAPLLLLTGIAALPAATPAVLRQAAPTQARTLAESIDTDVIAKIRAEGMDRSKVMWIEHYLTDVYGPRVTGSPNHENAAKWAVQTMGSWGMKNGKLEPWNWNHEGWLNEEAYGSIVSPVQDNLVFEVEAWTPSTRGVVTAAAVNLITPVGPPLAADAAAGGRGGGVQGPTEAELTAYLDGMAPRVKGAVVLVGAPRVPPFVEIEPAKRLSDDAAGRGRGDRGRGAGRGGAPVNTGRLTSTEVNQRVAQFLMKNGALVRVQDAYRQHGQITAFNPGATEGLSAADRYDSSKTLPTIVLRNEDYGRIARLLADGLAVQLKLYIRNKTFPAGKTSYNAVADIPGTDKADEVVMLGGHLDSWHAATGATDNAIGCAIMMEATRILQAIGVKPRRTIRVALWGGEEEGLLGSLAYVEQHFGSVETPKPEFAKLSAYWNIDTGTGLIRGASVFGPPEAAQVVTQLLAPFADFKLRTANASTSRTSAGTDSTSFNHAGLPGIGTQQDPIEYNSHTHHTNLDTYERILPDDVKKDAIITASVIYHLAMRDDLLPRFTKDQMPPLPQGRGGGQ